MTFECGVRVGVRTQLFDIDLNPVEAGETGRVVGHVGTLEIVTLDRGEDYLGDRRVVHAPAQAFGVIHQQRKTK